MARLLIVDDEQKISGMLKKYAIFEGHQVMEAADGFTAVELCETNDFDMIIIDVMMPELDGFSTVKAIRRFKQTPVIMLSARGEEYDKNHGFEVGVDDYVVKPFSVKELMMRVQAILSRRGTVVGDDADTAQYEGLFINYSARTVTVNGVRVDLSPKEYDLLFYMSRNKNIALSRERLLTEVWGFDYYGDDRTLDTHIKLLRKSLGEYQKFIVTVRGVGYRFEI